MSRKTYLYLVLLAALITPIGIRIHDGETTLESIYICICYFSVIIIYCILKTFDELKDRY